MFYGRWTFYGSMPRLNTGERLHGTFGRGRSVSTTSARQEIELPARYAGRKP